MQRDIENWRDRSGLGVLGPMECDMNSQVMQCKSDVMSFVKCNFALES